MKISSKITIAVTGSLFLLFYGWLAATYMQAKDLGVDVIVVTYSPTPTASPTATATFPPGTPTPTPTVVPSPSVAGRMKSVTFVFGTTFVGTIAGVCFAGAAGVCYTGSPADTSLTIPAPAGDTLTDIPYTISAGTLRIIRTQ